MKQNGRPTKMSNLLRRAVAQLKLRDIDSSRLLAAADTLEKRGTATITQ